MSYFTRAATLAITCPFTLDSCHANMNGQRHRMLPSRIGAFVVTILAIVVLGGSLASCGWAAEGAFSSGQYRNLFVEAGHSPKEVSHRITRTFEQFFHGDLRSEAIYFPAGTNAHGPLAFISDPSYQLPAFYELWARWGPSADRAFWAEAAKASRDFLGRAIHPVTGLTPDYANFDGSPWAAPWNPRSADFQVDAWRTAMNWSVDWAWWAKDAREPEWSERLQEFFQAQGIASFVNHFTIEGKPLGGAHSAGLVAMNAVASLAATHERSRQFVEELWRTPAPTGRYRYYDGMLYLLGLLHCGGEFRIWVPR